MLRAYSYNAVPRSPDERRSPEENCRRSAGKMGEVAEEAGSAQVIIIETKYVKVHTVREAAEQVARSVL